MDQFSLGNGEVYAYMEMLNPEILLEDFLKMHEDLNVYQSI